MTSEKSRKHAQAIRKDAEGQFAKPLKGDTHDGIASAKPTVITGSDDATAHKTPPGREKPEKEWDLNYDPRDRPPA